jgi:mitogen-activated protein kinase 15
MLAFSPSERLTASEAMLHPYIVPFCSAEEIEAAKAPAAHVLEPVDIPLPDATRFAVSEYRDALYEEIARSRRDLRQTRSKRNLKAARIVTIDASS